MKKGTIMKVVAVVAIVVAGFMIYMNKNKTSPGITVKAWDNIYEGNHIDFFYDDDSDNNKLKLLNKNYNISEKFSNLDNDVQVALRTADWIRSSLDVDSITKYTGTNGYDLLNEAQSDKKASGYEIAIIERDILKCIGIISRTGQLRIKPKKGSDISSYNVVEFYSKDEKKWILLDVINRRVFKNNGKYLSAIEFLETKKTEIETYNNKNYKEINRISDFKYSYSVNLDNTVKNKNSNSMLTYCSKNDLPTLNDNVSYYQPQIFTKNKELFDTVPYYKSEDKDKKAYIVIMFSNLVEKDKTEYPSIIVGAFKDSRMLKQYYIKVGDGKMTEVGKYQSVTLKKGVNTIEISEDGVNVASSIKIEYN